MKVKLAAANTVVTGENSCILCSEDFEYAAIVRGEINVEDLSSTYCGKVVTDEVVILKKSRVNNGAFHIVDLEITVRCPHCQSNVRFNRFHPLHL
ncbi:hypothetical protein [Neobacillus niacini]|uniref:hypothetical protein n=1 Tax=Neobacillus niacini TaxID=86668 RepID=UPI003982E96F